MRRTLSEIERRSQLEKARDQAGEQLEHARRRLKPLEAQRAEARAASRRFNTALAEVYRDPGAARRKFHARARRDGVAAASAEIARHPERFGSLRGVQVGPVRSAERSAALEKAAQLDRLTREHFSTTRQAWANREAYHASRTSVAAAERNVANMNAALGGGIGSERLLHRLTHDVHRLRPQQRRTLQRTVPLPQRQILSAVLSASQSFAREQGHER